MRFVVQVWEAWPGMVQTVTHSGPASEATGRDPLSRMRVYQLASALLTDSWADAERLRHHPVTEKVSGQLYAAVGSIAANIGEGYSRSSGRDRLASLSMRSVPCARVWHGTVQQSQSWGRS
jgi:hypothetical protein